MLGYEDEEVVVVVVVEVVQLEVTKTELTTSLNVMVMTTPRIFLGYGLCWESGERIARKETKSVLRHRPFESENGLLPEEVDNWTSTHAVSNLSR